MPDSFLRRIRALSLWPLLLLTLAALCNPLVAARRPHHRRRRIHRPLHYRWQNIPIIGGGFVTGIVADPAQKGLFYARTDVGGAYRWDSAARRWIPLTDWIGRAQANFTGVESIAVDPENPRRLYLAVGTYTASWAGNGAILVSTNQGRSFQTVPLPIPMGSNDPGRFAGERLAVDPNDGRIVYFGSRQNGLWRSRDFGQSWSQVASFPVHGATGGPGPDQGVGVIFEDFLTSSGPKGQPTPVIYAGVSATGAGPGHLSGLYVSRDAGATWNPVPGQPTGLYPNHGVLAADGMFYLTYANAAGPNGITGGAVWKLNTTTGQWTNITPIAEDNARSHFGYGAVAVNPRHPRTVMVSTLDRWQLGDNLARSTDGGHTWRLIESGHDHFDDALSPYLNWGHSAPKMGWWMGSLVIDPFNSAHVLYGTGATIWTSDDVTRADQGKPTWWRVGARGIEETVVLALLSPPAGPAHLLSGVGDLGGFTHLRLTRSPRAGMMRHPIFANTTSLDFAQRLSRRIVRAGTSTSGQYGAISEDGGLRWHPFPSQPAGIQAGGSIAISSDGRTIVWAARGAPVSVSRSLGRDWAPSHGLPAHLLRPQVRSDRVNPREFYLLDHRTGNLYRSTDGGVWFSLVTPRLPRRTSITLSPARAGDVWLATPHGLLHSDLAGRRFRRLDDVDAAWSVGFGRPAPGTRWPTLFLDGVVHGVDGIFRSTDGGAHWLRINDDQHQYGYIRMVIGDPRVFGRVYLGTSGRGIIVGDPLR